MLSTFNPNVSNDFSRTLPYALLLKSVFVFFMDAFILKKSYLLVKNISGEFLLQIFSPEEIYVQKKVSFKNRKAKVLREKLANG